MHAFAIETLIGPAVLPALSSLQSHSHTKQNPHVTLTRLGVVAWLGVVIDTFVLIHVHFVLFVVFVLFWGALGWMAVPVGTCSGHQW